VGQAATPQQLSCGFVFAGGLQAMQVICSTLRVGGSLEDGPLVFA